MDGGTKLRRRRLGVSFGYRSLVMTNVRLLTVVQMATFGSRWKEIEAAVGVRDQVTVKRRSWICYSGVGECSYALVSPACYERGGLLLSDLLRWRCSPTDLVDCLHMLTLAVGCRTMMNRTPPRRSVAAIVRAEPSRMY